MYSVTLKSVIKLKYNKITLFLFPISVSLICINKYHIPIN